ncbi:MAG: TM2 domain-containing membrane protein YozV [Cyclobacteriaceae bacterium]|jgi:TM2 domain-containing membrane protein YozV
MYSTAKGQSFSEQIGFLDHLRRIEAYNEGLLYLDTVSGANTEGQSDTLNYYRGKFHYYQVSLGPSITAFDRVRSQSPFFDESFLLSSYQMIYAGNWTSSQSRLLRAAERVTKESALISTFLLSGVYLLDRDFVGFDSIATDQFTINGQLKTAHQRLNNIRSDITARKHKSPFVAGLLSTILPGAGQMYTGNIGQGAMSLLTIGLFGLQAYESYQKDGLKSARFILFGGLFGGFYVANIWGAALGVKIERQEFNDQVNESILVTMHVPLRFLYN